MYDWTSKKQRGLTKKYNDLKERINECTKDFPVVDYRYWNLKLPCSRAILESKKIKKSYLQDLIKYLISRADYLESIKPADISSNIVVCIMPSNMWRSELIVFFDNDYYNDFFNRTDIFQTWIKLSSSKEFVNNWNLNVEEHKIVGYSERVLNDDGEYQEQELWFYFTQ
jgi:hypothetical protein